MRLALWADVATVYTNSSPITYRASKLNEAKICRYPDIIPNTKAMHVESYLNPKQNKYKPNLKK